MTHSVSSSPSPPALSADQLRSLEQLLLSLPRCTTPQEQLRLTLSLLAELLPIHQQGCLLEWTPDSPSLQVWHAHTNAACALPLSSCPELTPALSAKTIFRAPLSSQYELLFQPSKQPATPISQRAATPSDEEGVLWVPLPGLPGKRGALCLHLRSEPFLPQVTSYLTLLAASLALARHHDSSLPKNHLTNNKQTPTDAPAEAELNREQLLQRELGPSQEFFEQMIESSTASIVVADLQGRILLFNRSAEQLLGYTKTEALQSLSVEQLYPPGVAAQIMRRLRQSKTGNFPEPGQAEESPIHLVSKQGELIPVSLSASLILQNGQPLATWGLFTDLREKLARAKRWDKAQEQLQQHEKSSALAQLAGAAAHELNQPLTSVMGYAEYLKRSLPADPSWQRALSVILSQTERMAEIVRKVGRITHYETKTYVGRSQIVDLDRASGERDPGPTEPEAVSHTNILSEKKLSDD